MEILIAALLLLAAGYIIFRNVKKSSSCGCNCNNCSSHCSKYKK